MLFATEFVSLTLHLFYDQANLVHDWLYFFMEPRGAPILHDQEQKLLRHAKLFGRRVPLFLP